MEFTEGHRVKKHTVYYLVKKRKSFIYSMSRAGGTRNCNMKNKAHSVHSTHSAHKNKCSLIALTSAVCFAQSFIRLIEVFVFSWTWWNKHLSSFWLVTNLIHSTHPSTLYSFEFGLQSIITQVHLLSVLSWLFKPSLPLWIMLKPINIDQDSFCFNPTCLQEMSQS